MIAITTHDLCDLVMDEAVRRANLGGALVAARVHPDTFRRLVDDLSARVEGDIDGEPAFVTLHTAAGRVRLVCDPSARGDGRPSFEPTELRADPYEGRTPWPHPNEESREDD